MGGEMKLNVTDAVFEISDAEGVVSSGQLMGRI